MKSTHCLIMCLSLSALIVGRAAADFQWQHATPESQGMSSQKLEAMARDLAGRGTKALLVIRNDRIVFAWYAEGHGPTKRHYTASMAKALVAGVSLAAAMSDDLIALDDPASKFIPQWRETPRKTRITVRQLGSHTSGLEDAEADGLPHGDLTGWKGDFWKRLQVPRDPFTLSRDVTPVMFEPGTQFAYSNPGIAMLGYVVTAALRGKAHEDLRSLLRDRVMRPIGVPDDEWSVGYGQTFSVDGLPLVGTWGGGGYSALASARVGRLMLRLGDWEGKQLLRAEAVRQTTSDAGLPNGNGMGWWTNGQGLFDALPKDAFWAAGAGHQVLLVVPSMNLICVRNGGRLVQTTSESEYQAAKGRYLFSPLMDALTVQASASKIPKWVVFPDEEWRPATPREAGISDVQAWDRWVQETNKQAGGSAFQGEDHSDNQWGVAITRGGLLVQTFGDPDYRYQTASVGKCFTMACLQLAIDEGRIGSGDDLIKDFWTGAGQLNAPHKYLDQGHHASLTFDHLKTHRGAFPITNGWSWKAGKNYGKPAPPWAQWSGDPDKDNYAHAKPGTVGVSYSSGGYWRLAQALTAVWQQDLKQVLDERIMRHIGIPADRWDWIPGQVVRENGDWYPNMPGYGEFIDPPYRIEGHAVRGGPGWVVMSAKDLARWGLLVACGGEWQGRRLISQIQGHAGGNGSHAGGKGHDVLGAWGRVTSTFNHTSIPWKLFVAPPQRAAVDDEKGFVALFDGKTLTGWQGATEHWAVEEGTLVFIREGAARSKKELLGLKLMSTRQYADFILRFDIKLPPESNNGVAIRSPLDGDPAFAGMEIQVQDPKYYRKLKAYEVFGSIYGVVPAKTGYLKANGLWNTQEILGMGDRVRVTLNGTVIVDADLAAIGTTTMDRADHPGLKRAAGHIGFCGHTGRVAYRNIRIKDLSQ